MQRAGTGGIQAQVWIRVWEKHSGEKAPLWIEELWRIVQGLPSGNSVCNGLSSKIHQSVLVVTSINEDGGLRVL